MFKFSQTAHRADFILVKMSKIERKIQPQLPEAEIEPEVFIPLSDVLDIIDKSSLLQLQKDKLRKTFEDFEPSDELSEKDINLINLTIKAVVEGLLDVTFNQLTPGEQRRIKAELERYKISDFDIDKI